MDYVCKLILHCCTTAFYTLNIFSHGKNVNFDDDK